MSKKSPSGFISFSVDATAGGAANSVSDLLTLLDERGLPTTFGFDLASQSGLAKEVHDRITGHEVALVAGPSWTGPQVDRTRFAQELIRRISAADEAGFNVTTLLLKAGELSRHLDLLVKHRISVVRGVPARTLTPGLRFYPHLSRFGVWRSPEPVVYPGTGRWWLGGDLVQVGRLVREAVRQRGILHLAIAPSDAMGNRKHITKLFDLCRSLVEEAEVGVATLGRLVHHFTRTSQSSRSALRAA